MQLPAVRGRLPSRMRSDQRYDHHRPSRRRRWCSQEQPVEEVIGQDALEVEEEAHPPSHEEA